MRGAPQLLDQSPSAFQRRVVEALAPHANELALQWQLLVAEIDYGYDLERAWIEHRAPARPRCERRRNQCRFGTRLAIHGIAIGRQSILPRCGERSIPGRR